METATYTAFAGEHRIVTAELAPMLLAIKKHLQSGGDEPLIFDDRTGRQVDFDFRGTPEDVLARVAPAPAQAGPGRPKLGVVSREVTLLPRHWEWLEAQPSGISAALRRLVDEARKLEPEHERARLAREAASRFMWVMAGNLAGFEEASRALFAEEPKRFARLIKPWPADVRGHLLHLLGLNPTRAKRRSAGGSGR